MDVFTGLDPDANPDELEEKQRLINQILELQNTLDGKNIFFRIFFKAVVLTQNLQNSGRYPLQKKIIPQNNDII